MERLTLKPPKASPCQPLLVPSCHGGGGGRVEHTQNLSCLHKSPPALNSPVDQLLLSCNLSPALTQKTNTVALASPHSEHDFLDCVL